MMGSESCVASRPHSCVSLSNFPLDIMGKFIFQCYTVKIGRM